MKTSKNAILRVANMFAVVLAFFAPPAAAVGAAENPAEIVKKLADAYYAGQLSVDSAAALFKGKCENRREGDYWVMDCREPMVVLVLRGQETNAVVDEAELRFGLEANLVLRDLESFLGPWKLVFSSKTSSVSFQAAGGAGPPAVIFAHLFTARPSPTSPVLSVRFR